MIKTFCRTILFIIMLISFPKLFCKEKKEVIKLGCTLDLSRGARDYGNIYQRTLNYMIDKVNREGGVQGKDIQLTILKDNYSSQKARENIQDLLAEHIDIIVCPVGTPTLKSYINLVRDKRIAVLFPEASSSIFRNPDLVNIIHLVESHFSLGYELLRNVLRDENIGNIGFIYQNDDFGKDMLSGAQKALNEFNISKEKYIALAYESNNVEFSDMIEQLEEYGVNSIVFFSTSRAAMAFIQQMGLAKIRSKKIFAAPDLQIDEFEKYAKVHNVDLTIINELPNPLESDLKIAEQFRSEVEKSNGRLILNVYCFKVYISISLLIERLKKIEGPITKDTILSSLALIRNYDFGGLKLNYEKDRQLLHSVWLNFGEKRWKTIDTGANSIKEKPRHTVKADGSKKGVTSRKQKNNVIRVGSTFDLEKGLRLKGLNYNKCIKYLIEEQNKNGGINGIPLEFISRNDDYDPSNALNNVKDLFSAYNIRTLLFPTGTVTLEYFLDYALENQILILFPGSRSSIFRKPQYINMVHYGPSYYQEGHVIAKQLMKILGNPSEGNDFKKIAFVYQDDNAGRDHLKGAKDALNDLGFNHKSFVEVAYRRNNLEFSDAIRKIKESRVHTICFFSTSIATQSFIRQFGIEEVRKKNLYGCSELLADAFQKFIKSHALSFIISSIVPNPNREKNGEANELPIIRDFHKVVEKSQGALSIDAITFEIFIGMSLFIKILKEIEPPITNEKIISAFEKVDINFGGLDLKFDKDRQLLHSVWLSEGKPKWKKIDLKQPDNFSVEEFEPTGFF